MQAAWLVGFVGQEPIARPHDPVKEQALKPPPSTKHVAEVTPASAVGQLFVIWQFGTNAQLDAKVPPTVQAVALAFVPHAGPTKAQEPV